MAGKVRGRKVAAVDSAGAAMGTTGLAIFAVIEWKLMPHCPVRVVLVLGTAAWAATVITVWLIRKRGIRALSGWRSRSAVGHSK